MKKDYYKILGIDQNATQEEIKRAYRKLSYEHNPEFNSNPESVLIFDEIAEAYDILSNQKKKANYDGVTDKNFEKVVSNMSLNDVLDEIVKTPPAKKQGKSSSNFVGFTVSAQSTPKQPKKQGDTDVNLSKYDIHGDVYITQEEVEKGARRDIDLQKKGSLDTRTVEVFIPSGTQNGERVKVPHEGHDSPFGERGDLWLTVHVEAEEAKEEGFSSGTSPKNKPSEKGVDFETKISLPYSVFCLGGEIGVETPQGFSQLPIPPLSKHGTVLTFKDMGYSPQTGTGPIGSLKLHLQLLFPEALNENHKKALEELRKCGL